MRMKRKRENTIKNDRIKRTSYENDFVKTSIICLSDLLISYLIPKYFIVFGKGVRYVPRMDCKDVVNIICCNRLLKESYSHKLKKEVIMMIHLVINWNTEELKFVRRLMLEPTLYPESTYDFFERNKQLCLRELWIDGSISYRRFPELPRTIQKLIIEEPLTIDSLHEFFKKSFPSHNCLRELDIYTIAPEFYQGSVFPGSLQFLESLRIKVLSLNWLKHRLNIFPETLKYLIISRLSDEQIDFEPGILPENLLHFCVETRCRFNIVKGSLPSRLTKLVLSEYSGKEIKPDVLPPSLRYIKLENFDNNGVLLEPGIFPEGLEELDIGDIFNQTLGSNVLPRSLTALNLGERYNNNNKPMIPGSLGHKLVDFKFGSDFDQMIDVNVLPETLTRIEFGKNFNQPLISLPCKLQRLKFGHKWNQQLVQGIIPHSVTELIFGHDFNQPLLQGVIPGSIISLEFGENFNQPADKFMVPRTLETLKIQENQKEKIYKRENIRHSA